MTFVWSRVVWTTTLISWDGRRENDEGDHQGGRDEPSETSVALVLTMLVSATRVGADGIGADPLGPCNWDNATSDEPRARRQHWADTRAGAAHLAGLVRNCGARGSGFTWRGCGYRVPYPNPWLQYHGVHCDGCRPLSCGPSGPRGCLQSLQDNNYQHLGGSNCIIVPSESIV